MIFKLANYAVMGIALFYAAEGTGLIERGRYFPTLPRLEASASDPMAWLGAAQWGVGRVVNMAQNSDAVANVAESAPRDLNLENITTFAKRLEAKREETLKSSFGQYGS